MRSLSAFLLSSLLVGNLLLPGTLVAVGARTDLQGLVHACDPGDTLRLPAGRYTGATLASPLTLVGSGPATIIDGGGRGSALVLKSAGISVSNLRVTGSGTDVTAKESGIWIDRTASDALISKVRIDSCGFGIWADRAPRPLIAACDIEGREDIPIMSDRGNGIHVFKVEGGVVRDNRITAGRDGIYISNSRECLIENNHLRRSRFAIHYMYAHENRVIGNHTDSSSVGIALMYSKRIYVRGNRVRNARTHGMLLRNLYESRIANNDVRVSKDGFFFSGCFLDTLANNWIEENEIGIQVSDSPRNHLVANAFVDNGRQFVYQGYSRIVWDGGANGGNYWSDYVGWDRNGDGIGDRPHHLSDIASYLVGRFPAVRLVLQSPAMLLLRGLEAQFPVMRPPGITEARPLMRPPSSARL